MGAKKLRSIVTVAARGRMNRGNVVQKALGIKFLPNLRENSGVARGTDRSGRHLCRGGKMGVGEKNLFVNFA
jgi:hypothetical protein